MVFDKVQFGRQSVVGTAVAAAKIYPCKAEAPELDRAHRLPDEDWGRMSDAQPGRGHYGTRGASTRLTTDVTFETIMDLLEMHWAGGVSPTGTNPYTWTYTADETSLTTKYYTIELGSEAATDQWRLTGCVVDELTLGFDALSAPGNAPWTADASVLALNREVNALTGALSGPSTSETLEGVYTTIAQGATSTAFGSLSALTASLVSFQLTSRMPFVRRIYGGSSDTGTAWGLSEKPGITFTAGIAVGSTAKTDIHDEFTSGALTERRWRLVNTSGSKTFTVDSRVQYRTVSRTDRAGEAIYGVEGVMTYDSTLAGRIQVVSAGTAVSAL